MGSYEIRGDLCEVRGALIAIAGDLYEIRGDLAGIPGIDVRLWVICGILTGSLWDCPGFAGNLPGKGPAEPVEAFCERGAWCGASRRLRAF